ncbi:MAG: glycoside hydrolase family 2 [Anaerolineae bacterium]|nr:glycoside hydrolase family 2 [Anaerolineae bacterium]
MPIPRPEYPRPQFQRAQWLNLNGTWQFDFDDANQGLAGHWFDQHDFSQKIEVPFVFQSKLSGIGTNVIHDIVWYRREFSTPAEWNGQQIHLNFEAVDYRATVWINGVFAGFHEGGHTPFSLDITALLKGDTNAIVLRAEDITNDKGQPRGKQYWEKDSASIFYTRTTGIWQTVWLEPVAKTYLERIIITPQLESGSVQVAYEISGDVDTPYEIETSISFGGHTIVSESKAIDNSADKKKWATNPHSVFSTSPTFSLGDNLKVWSPETPNLYDVSMQIKRDGKLLDEVNSYFGLRSVTLKDGKLLLNGQPYYLKFVLDQGYNPDGILTFPSDEYIRKDIELTKAMGFNGARKHQKVEEQRFHYWADKMGFLLWGEMANVYIYSETAIQRVATEWQAAIRRDYNHPSIIAWTPMNESWGVPNLMTDPRQAQHLVAMYAITKSLDPSRPVISNDGWEHAKTDILTMHDYEGKRDILTPRYATQASTLASRPADRDLALPGFPYEGQPIMVTEFGGIGYKKDAQEGWGYTTASDDEDFIERYKAVVESIYASDTISGFCYTQITDVEQEINGLLTYDRQPKAPLEIIKQINDQKPTT